MGLTAALLVGSACGTPPAWNVDRWRAEAALRTTLATMREALAQYRGDRGRCPGSLDQLVRAGYLYKLPVDPITRSAETWVVEPGGAGPSPGCAGGIAQVRSGSDRVGLDGTPYSSW